jgi:SAM-dependent methyltransferase
MRIAALQLAARPFDAARRHGCTNVMAAYDPIAWCYDRYWADGFDALAWSVWEKLIAPRLAADAAVLDVGCGCGHFTRRLISSGYRVVAAEPSLRMLEHLCRRAPGAAVVAADARALPVRRHFDAVLFTFDGLNHLLSAHDVRSAFGSIAAALRPGGLFFFDLLGEAAYRLAWQGERIITGDDHLIVVRGHYDADSQRASTDVVIFRCIGTDWQRTDSSVHQRCCDRAEIEDAAHRAGFQSLQWWDADNDLALSGPLALGRFFCVAAR